MTAGSRIYWNKEFLQSEITPIFWGIRVASRSIIYTILIIMDMTIVSDNFQDQVKEGEGS